MGNLNHCTFIGRLAADPELRSTTSGKAVVNIRLVVNSYRKDSTTGEKNEYTEYIPIELWAHQAAHAQRLLTKGREIYVVGRLRTRRYDKEGETRYSTSIVCDSFQLVGPRPTSTSSEPEQVPEPADELVAVDPADDDEIPF